MTKKQQESDIITDYTLMRVTLTVAVSTYLCDEHADRRDSEAIEAILEELNNVDTDIIVLSSKFEPLTLTKRAEA